MLKSYFLSRQWALWAWGGMLLLCASVGLEVSVHVWINSWYRETWDFLQNPHPLLREAVADADADWHMRLPESAAEETAAGAPARAPAGFIAQFTVWIKSGINNIVYFFVPDLYPAGPATLSQLAESNLARFWRYVVQFCVIVFPFIFLKMFTNFFAQHYAFRWRQAITYAYLPLWAKTGRDIEGASQRLQQDPERFARIVEGLGLGLFRDILTLVAFIPILWSVSSEIAERFDAAVGLTQAPFALPFLTWTAQTAGSLMWVALALALGGTLISYFVGIKLPGLEYNNQKVEARFRKRLTYGEDDKQFADMPSLTELFTGLRFNYFRLYLHYAYFSLWSTMFSQFLIIADLILIGTGVALGIITLGFLNQISHAFSRVSESLSYFINNWTTVTELMSVVKRLREFERNIGYAGAPLTGEAPPVQQIR